jgi:hypothetical protein
MQELLARLQGLPEVKSVGLSAVGLLGGGSWNDRLTLEDRGREVIGDVVHCNAVTSGFFESFGVTFGAGRNFDERDVHDLAGSGQVEKFQTSSAIAEPGETLLRQPPSISAAQSNQRTTRQIVM